MFSFEIIIGIIPFLTSNLTACLKWSVNQQTVKGSTGFFYITEIIYSFNCIQSLKLRKVLIE